MKVIILGVGASKGKINAPVAKDFGKYLNDNNLLCECPNLCKVIEDLLKYPKIFYPNLEVNKQNWPLDKISSAINNRHKLRDIVDWEDPLWSEANRDLTKAMLRVYGRDAYENIQGVDIKAGSISDEFGKLKGGDCVIDFNYDMLAEATLNAIKPSEWVRVNGVTTETTLKKNATLCKLHGSVAWVKRSPEKGLGMCILDRPMKVEEYYKNKSTGITTEPGMVGLGPFKSELIMPEVQSQVPVFYNTLTSQWKHALDKIREATEIVVMGYSFPLEDYHSIYLFSDVVAKRKTEPEKISFYQITESCVKGRIASLFKVSEEKIEYKGQVFP